MGAVRNSSDGAKQIRCYVSLCPSFNDLGKYWDKLISVNVVTVLLWPLSLSLSLQGTIHIIPNPSSHFPGFNTTIKIPFWASKVLSVYFIYRYMNAWLSAALLNFQSTYLSSLDLQFSMPTSSVQHQMSLHLFKACLQWELALPFLILYCLNLLAFWRDHSVNLIAC